MKKTTVVAFLVILISSTLIACTNSNEAKSAKKSDTNSIKQSDMKEFVVIAKTGPNPEDYIFEPAEIKVNVGEQVKITLESEDELQHALWLPSTDKPEITNGESFIFTGKQPGEVLGKCSELCGTGHALMNFKVIVE
jgi:cytochrome c oxidase subunit II